MPVTNTLVSETFAGNGVATVFPISLTYLKTSHLVVTRTVSGVPTVLAMGPDYTVGVNGVTLAVALASGATLKVERVVPYTQETNFRTAGNFFPETHQDALDGLTMQTQQLSAKTTELTAADVALAAAIVTGDAAERANTTAQIVLVRAEQATSIGGAIDAKTVIATNTSAARSLADRFGQVFSVRDFGAVGDGVTNDTTAIQSAINAAKAQGGSLMKTVWFPSGIYLVTGTLTQNADKVALRGAGPQDVILLHTAASGSTDAVVFEIPSGQALRNAISGMTLRSTSTNTRRLLSVVRQTGFYARDVVFDSSTATHTDGCWVHSLINCRFEQLVFRNFSSGGFRLATGVGVASTGTVIFNSLLGTADNLVGNGTIPALGCHFASANGLVVTGGIAMDLQPSTAFNTAVKNMLLKELVPKAWGTVTGGATPVLGDSMNVASVAISVFTNQQLRVTWAEPFANDTYVPFFHNGGAGQTGHAAGVKSATVMDIALYTSAGAAINLSSTAASVSFVVFGRQ